MEPSSSTKGFFQAHPTVPSQLQEDAVFRRIISLHLPSPTPTEALEDLSRFSNLVLSRRVLAHGADAERNLPYLRPLTTFGVENKQDPLVTSEGWRSLQDIGISEGIVGLGYIFNDGVRWNNRSYQFIKYHLWTGSAAMVTCPSAMTDGAARLLGKYTNTENGVIFAEARRRLISRDPTIAWTSGQWMTERKGGSDVRGTETVAQRISAHDQARDDVDANGVLLGPWKIDGFKWFSSATDANMTILLAKTGPQGQVSAFYAPLRRKVKGGVDGETELNGIRIQRLKNKLGTKTLPTAELELKGMRGYLIGQEGKGVKEISTLLNITRVYNMAGAVGNWGRGLAISRSFARVRAISGKLLTNIPAHVRALAQEHVKYSANMHLVYLVVALLGISEGQDSSNTQAAQASIIPQSNEQAMALLRLLTPMAKAQTALRSIKGLRACMENLGGVGYLENEDPMLNIARIFRDTCVLSIWEGTTDVMADDVVRVMKGRDGQACSAAVQSWVEHALQVAIKHGFVPEAQKLKGLWEGWANDTKTKDGERLRWEGRKYMATLERIVCGCLLILDATRDNDPVSREIARRWIQPQAELYDSWKVETAWDKKIVFGGDESATARL
ncbi:hypothetical protein AJ80_07814 [Polytolypa hystricis UAMH7299]|uniref:Acyl-CoA dehydrogenase/oxidase C-terminal domain-containing protein n=1 Tax=Polytolypa hystricis (strain UAMH7299) TaxID=1447883 RepID=A0A2B7XIV3_POLH7|nr:hypothetical protein AJ80_07814 [Polytolypa hystricis UAMH7299]